MSLFSLTSATLSNSQRRNIKISQTSLERRKSAGPGGKELYSFFPFSCLHLHIHYSVTFKAFFFLPFVTIQPQKQPSYLSQVQGKLSMIKSYRCRNKRLKKILHITTELFRLGPALGRGLYLPLEQRPTPYICVSFYTLQA